MIVLHQIKTGLEISEEKLINICASALKVDKNRISKLKLIRESLDARKKPQLFRVFEIGVMLKGVEGIQAEKKYISRIKGLRADAEEIISYRFPYLSDGSQERPVIIGFGPAGIFCALNLARAGFRPIVLERGKAVADRKADVNAFWSGEKLNTESNVLFGEGGAGTFSDGKLNTLVKGSKDIQRFVMDTFVEFGADNEICYSYKPHIGTDVLEQIIPRMREEIIRLGGEVLFSHKVTELITVEDRLTGVRVSTLAGEKIIECHNVCLAIGHSARDTFRMLKELGAELAAKPFAVGVRCEHDQEMINKSQYGESYSNILGAAPYKLTAKAGDGRGVYSFCMCPGGYVVNSSSEPGRLCVNGMSYHDRNSGRANSAIVVSVGPEDFPGEDPLRGVYWQESFEEKAYEHRNGYIPVQILQDFKNNKTGEVTLNPCIKGKWTAGNLKEYLPDFVSKAIDEGFNEFGRKIRGFDNDDTLLIGFESRTSSPVRICRDDAFESNIKGIYPCGEGAGYAGGITSAAVDGCRVAEAIAKKLLSKED